MKRKIVGVVVMLGLVSGLLGWRIWMQEAALRGPAGGSGVVEGRTIRLSSRVGGRIEALPVAEGDAVEAGALVVQLDCVEAEAALAEAEAGVAGAQEQANAAARAAEAARAAAGAAGATAAAADAQARAVQTQGSAAERQAGRLDAVVDDISAAQRDQARSTADATLLQAQAADAQRRAGSAQARAASDQAAAAEAQAAAAARMVAAAEARRSRARLAVDECTLTSPQPGFVQLLPYEVGELVAPGATLATVVDMRVARASFYLPNADLAAARPGGAARVIADAWPGEVFEGTVATVATEPEFTPRNIQTRSDRDRLVYRVEVEVDNPDGRLRPGMPIVVKLDPPDAAQARAAGAQP